MSAMCGDPGDRSPFERERSTKGQTIFHPLRSAVSTMSEQAVVAHAYAEAPCNPIQEDRHDERRPAKQEQSRHGADVQENEEECRNRSDGLREGPVISKDARAHRRRQITGLVIHPLQVVSPQTAHPSIVYTFWHFTHRPMQAYRESV